jgi:methyl-accepting chemotaxis protein
MEQLDTASKGLENIMGTEAYGSAVSRFFQEQLAWQDKIAKTANPQIDGALRAVNLPSRSQMNRLFERMVGMEERLDDLETESRQIGRSLRTSIDAVGELAQHVSTFAEQLTGMDQHLEGVFARTESIRQRLEDVHARTENVAQQVVALASRPETPSQSSQSSEATSPPSPQRPPRSRSRRKSTPDS